MQTADLIVKIILLIIAILGSVISYYIIPVLKTKANVDNYALFNDFVINAVRAANQLYTKEEWEKKKEYVVNLVLDYLSDNTGLNFTDEQIDAIIEGVVNEVKHIGGNL